MTLNSTNGLARLNGEVKRRTDVVGIFPNDEVIFRLGGSILLEQNDKWAVQRDRYMTLEAMAGISDDLAIRLPAMVIQSARPTRDADKRQAGVIPTALTTDRCSLSSSDGLDAIWISNQELPCGVAYVYDLLVGIPDHTTELVCPQILVTSPAVV